MLLTLLSESRDEALGQTQNGRARFQKGVLQMLKQATTSLSFSPCGGILTRWQDEEQHILFPPQVVRIGKVLKDRGGMFAAFPFLRELF